MSELKQCPFCGNDITVWQTGFGIVKVIECKICKIRFVFPWYKAGKDLADAWNMRASEKEKHEQEIEQ